MNLNQKEVSTIHSVVDKLCASTTLQVILFLDTCSILDVLRIPIRTKDKKHLEMISTVELILNYAQQDKIAILVHNQTLEELDRNKQNIINELDRYLNSLNGHLKEYEIISGVTHSGMITEDMRSKYLGYYEQLLLLAQTIQTHKAERNNAVERSLKGIMPSRKGATADALIYEHMLSVAKKTYDKNFNGDFLFISSNTKDFIRCNSALLEAEMKHNNFQYVDDWLTLNKYCRSL